MRKALLIVGAVLVAIVVAGLASGSSRSPYQLRCAQGAVRGLAFVKGDSHGLANLGTAYTNSNVVFGYKFNCTGRDIYVRRAGNGFDVWFVGNAAIFAVGSVVGPNGGAVSTTRSPDGAIHVTVSGPTQGDNFAPRSDQPFVVIIL